jgi:hypothetical protein
MQSAYAVKVHLLNSAHAAQRSRVGAGVGGSVSSVNVTFFSLHDLRYTSSRTRTRPSSQRLIRTATTLSLLYHFKPEVDRSKGASRRCTASQRLTAELATPTVSVDGLPCFMTCHARRAFSQPLSLLSRDVPPLIPTLIGLTGIVSMIESLLHHLIGGDLHPCIAADE